MRDSRRQDAAARKASKRRRRQVGVSCQQSTGNRLTSRPFGGEMSSAMLSSRLLFDFTSAKHPARQRITQLLCRCL